MRYVVALTSAVALALGGCVTSGGTPASTASAVPKREPITLTTCKAPLASVDLQLAPDFSQRLKDIERLPPVGYVEDVVRRSGCFNLVRGKADYQVKVTVDARTETPYGGATGLAATAANFLLPLGALAQGVLGGSVMAGYSIAEINASVHQEIVFSDGSYESIVTKTEPVHGNSGYYIPNGAAGEWEKTPEGKALVLAQIRATNDFIEHVRNRQVAAAPTPKVPAASPARKVQKPN